MATENQDVDKPVPIKVSLPSQPISFSNENYAGSLNFNISFNTDLIWSPLQPNTIYIKRNQPFSTTFSVTLKKLQHLFIRVLPVSVENGESMRPVYRCSNHKSSDEPSNFCIEDRIISHIIRCNKKNARYNGENNKDHLNIVIPLRNLQLGLNKLDIIFAFMCSRTCFKSKQLSIMFRLENQEGDVLGQRALDVGVNPNYLNKVEKSPKPFNVTPPKKRDDKLLE